MSDEQDIFDFIESLSAKISGVSVLLRKDLQKKIVSLLTKGKTPLISATLAEPLITKAFSKIETLTSDGFDDVLKKIRNNLAEVNITLTKADIAKITELKSVILDQIAIPLDKLKADIKKTMLQTIVKGDSAADIIEALKKTYPAFSGQIGTLVNTSLQQFYTQTNFEKIKDKYDKFLYQGPDDGLTRPFCKHHVGKWFDADEAAEVQSVRSTLYNCRHQLLAINETQAERYEHGTVNTSLA